MFTDRWLELIKVGTQWANLGVSVVPAQPHSKAVLIHWREWESKTPTHRDLSTWFSTGMNNIAVVGGTGRENEKLLILDFDSMDLAIEFGKRSGDLYRTYTETSGRGLHLFYLVDDPTTKRFIECEALGLGHLCNIYPSIHPNGQLYQRVINDHHGLLRVKTSQLFSLLSEIPVKEALTTQQEGRQASKLNDDGRSVVKRVKAAYSLVEVASSLTQLKPSGENRWFVGKCPFHQDTTPSFWVDGARGLWGCFSPSCPGSKGGDVINLVALSKKISVGEAVRELARGLA